MRRVRSSALQSIRVIVICLAFLSLFTVNDANAGTRHQNATGFSVALQPFSLDPLTSHEEATSRPTHEPRGLRAVAAAPMKVAYTVPRASAAFPFDSQKPTQGDTGVALQPFRLAYQTPHRKQDPRPQPEPEENYDSGYEQPQPDSDEEETDKIGSHTDGLIVAGKRAVLRDGIAYAPSQAPQSVKEVIWAANQLHRKPYVWGGGHRSFNDHGYDCSGSVSFALHGAGLIAAPVLSDDLMRYGERGRGRWITIYSRSGHTFAVIAGLRFDTTDLSRGGNVGPRWYAEGRDTRGYVARHPGGF